MLSTDFRVDMAVWQDGVTFQTALASKPAADFGQLIGVNAAVEPVAEAKAETSDAQPVAAVSAAPVVLVAQENFAPQSAAVPAVKEELTPLVAADADVKPGSRLNAELARTGFSQKPEKLIGKESPYNMSDAKAKARETAQSVQKTRAPSANEKVFSMDKAARFHNAQHQFGVSQMPTVSASDAAKRMRMDEMRQQAKNKTIDEANTTLAQKRSAPIDTAAIRAQVSADGFGYQRDKLPSASSQSVSPAASWFPEAMTRQLDAYEAARKVSAQYGTSAAETVADYNV